MNSSPAPAPHAGDADSRYPVVRYRFSEDDVRRCVRSFPLSIRYFAPISIAMAALPGLVLLGVFRLTYAVGFSFAFIVTLLLREWFMRKNRFGFDYDQVEMTMTLIHEQYLEHRSPTSITYRHWRMVNSIKQIGSDILIQLSSLYRLLLPARGFQNTHEQQRFFDVANEKRLASLQQPMEPMPKIVLNPEPISPQFECTVFEFVQRQNLVNQERLRNRMGVGWAFLFMVVPCLFSIAVVVGLRMFGLAGKFTLIELLGVAAFMVVTPPLIGIASRCISAWVTPDHANESIMIQVDVDQHGLEVFYSMETTFMQWQGLSPPVLLRNHSIAIVSKDGVAAVVIPPTAFESGRAQDDFLQLIWSRTAQHVHAQPMANARSSEETGNPFQAPLDH